MSVATAETPTASPPRSLLWPAVVSALLVPAVILLPFPVASAWTQGGYASRDALVDALTAAFVDYWAAGTGVISADLARPVEFWSHFHLAKAALAAMLLVALVLLCVRSWVASTRAVTGGRRLAAGALSAVAALMSLLALVVVVANLQGAVAPLSSALGLLPIGRPGGLAEVSTQVTDGLAAGVASPALDALVQDFTTYHLAMVVLGSVATATLLVTAVLGWRRRARFTTSTHRGRGLLTAAVVAAVVTGAFFAVVTVGNLSTVTHPVSALLGFFRGGG